MIYSKNLINMGDLSGVPLSRPTDAGAYWYGIKHSHFFEQILEFLKQVKVKPKGRPGFVVANGGLDMIGYQNTNNFCLGFANYNSRRSKIKIYIGVKEKNYSYVVDAFLLGRRRTKSFNLLTELHEAFDDKIKETVSIHHDAQRLEIDKDEKNQILMDALHEHRTLINQTFSLLPCTMLEEIDNNLRKKEVLVLSDLLCAYSKAIQKTPPFLQMERLHYFYHLATGII